MKTLEQLQQEHSEMAATALDLGLELPAELLVDFDVSTVGERITKEIDKLIRAYRAGIDADSSSEDESAPSDEKPVATPRKKAQKAPAKKAASKKSTKVPAEEKPATTAEGDTPVAKPAKKAAKAAKKPAKKAATKVKGAEKAPSTRSKFPSDAIVTWIAKDGNPCREGTGRFDRYELLRKASGKTVEKVLAAGVPSATLINASAAKVIKIA